MTGSGEESTAKRIEHEMNGRQFAENAFFFIISAVELSHVRITRNTFQSEFVVYTLAIPLFSFHILKGKNHSAFFFGSAEM